METKDSKRSGILDTGCTSGAGAEMDMEYFHDTGLPSKKVFMLPDASKIPATKIMRLKHNLRRDEHSAESALLTDKCAKDGGPGLHCSIRQKRG